MRPTADFQSPDGVRAVWVLSRVRTMTGRWVSRAWSRRGVPEVLILGVVFALTLVAQPIQGTLASWTDQVPVTGNSIGTNTLAPPTSLAVSQACVADPTPVLRSPGGTAFAGGTQSGTLTINKPTSAATGDVLIAVMTWAGNLSSATPSAPAGWNLIRADRHTEIGLFAYYKVATASEPSSYTWTVAANGGAGGIAAYSGVDTANPVNTTSGAIDKTAPSLTTTRNNVMLIGSFGVIGQSNVSQPASMTQLWSGYSSSSGQSDANASNLGAQESWPTAGATGTRTYTGGGARGASQLIALQPPAYPQATVTWTPSASTFATGQNYTRSPGGTPATLGPSVSSRVTGLLTSGTAYAVGITATYYNWVSTTSSIGFTGRSCWPM